LPRTLDKGSFINLQTYKATIENEVSTFMKKKYDSMIKQGSYDEEFVQLYKEYSFHATQYQRCLREIFRELCQLNMTMSEIAQDLSSKNSIMSSAIYLEGIVHPQKKTCYKNDIKNLLEQFERTIRLFEQTRISCTCTILDLYFRETASPHFEIRSEEISRIYPISNLTSALSTQRKPFPDENSLPNPQSLNKILSESVLSAKSSFINEPRKRLILNDLSIDQNTSGWVLPTERDFEFGQRGGSLNSLGSKTVSAKEISKLEIKSKSINYTGKKLSCITPILKNKDLQLGIDFSNTISNTAYITSLNTKKNGMMSFQSKKKNLFLTSFENKENELNLTNRSETSKQFSQEGQLSNIFKENKFYRGKLNNASSLLKFR
jgi:hypothetical protein